MESRAVGWRNDSRRADRVWGWGGNHRTVKDAMHYEIVCTPEDLAGGIDWDTVHQPALCRTNGRSCGAATAARRPRSCTTCSASPRPATLATASSARGRRRRCAITSRRTASTSTAASGRQTWTALLTGQPEVTADELGPVKR